MSGINQILSFPGLTLAGIAESLVAIKMFPQYYSDQTHLSTMAVILAANYAFGLVYWNLIYPNFLSPLRNLPGPRSLISLAHRTILVQDRPSGELWLDLIKKYPGQELLSLTFRRSGVVITHPRLLADLLVHRCYDFTKPSRVSNFLRHVLGDGLIILEGDQHKFMRKNTMPAFNFRHIKELYPMMMSKANLLTKTLNQEIKSGEKDAEIVELSTWASKITIDIIGIAGLGRKFNVVEKASDPLQEIYEELLEPSNDKLLFAMLSLGFGYDFVKLIPWKMNDLFKYLSKSLDDICRPMIRDKRDAIAKKQDDHFDVLSLLIKSDNFSDSELKDQLLTFLAAGHETTASALTWACYLLAKFPDIQQKLREEVAEAFPDGHVPEEASELAGTLEQLPLLNGIMNETFRLYPTVPQTLREAQVDTRLGDHVIPKGTVVSVSMWMINRSPEVWGADADQFKPERWINDDGKPNQNGGSGSNYDFLTFLHGPRSCIGQNFAKAEMRCLLAAMVGSFKWDLAMDEKKILPRGVITIKPAHGMYLKLTPLEA